MQARATSVIAAGQWDISREVGYIRTEAENRLRRRMRFETVDGFVFLLDLPRVTKLADGDGLLLEDGGVIRVVAEPEALIEITAFDDHALTKIAWHLGNRHVPVQFLRHALRIRADDPIEQLVERLGGDMTPISAAFDPEPGAFVHG
jgi:urease accessory protein